MRVPQRFRRHHAHGVVRLLDLTANLQKLCTDGLQMLRNYVFYRHVALRYRRRKHKGACLDLVRNNAILRPVQLRHALDTDHIRTRALDIRAHAVQKVRQINDMRLLRRILNHGGTLRHHCRHHHVHGRTHSHHIHIDMVPLKLHRLRDNQAVLDSYTRTERTKAFDMLVNGTKPDITAARKSHLRFAVFTKKRSQQIVGSSDFFDIIVLDHQIVNL